MKVLNKKNKGIALVAAVVITLIVSLVAVAIASTTSVSKRASSSTFDFISGYANALAGVNFGEVILLTASGDEIKNGTAAFGTNLKDSSEHKIATWVSPDCSNEVSTLEKNGCLWWIGNDFNSDNLTEVGSDFYGESNKGATMFKLERRNETTSFDNESSLIANLGKAYYRVTSVGIPDTSDGGLVKMQGIIAVVTEINSIGSENNGVVELSVGADE